MAEHPNVELFRRGYAAFQNGDLDGVRALFADGIRWHTPGSGRFSGTRNGVDDTIALFLQQFEDSGGTFKVELHDVVGNDEHAVALGTWSAQRNGRSERSNYTHVVHVEGGRLTESWIFDEDPARADAFWG